VSPQAEAAIIGAVAALIGALIGGLVTAVGWYVTKRKEDLFRRQEASLNYRQRQIEDLYGPLFGIIQQSRAVYDVAKKFVPINKDGRIDVQNFQPEHEKIWAHYVDSYIRPLNKQAVELIRSKMYLLNSDTLPESFRQFLEHTTHLEAVNSLAREGLNTFPNAPWAGYPAQFNQDVKEALDNLLIQYKSEIRLLRGAPSANSTSLIRQT
jgi:hypothetical protein